MSRALLRQPWCKSYRNDAARPFLSHSGITIPRSSLSSSLIYTTNHRCFSLTSRLRSENSPSENPDSKEPTEEKNESPDNDLSTPAQPIIPWYLQAEAQEEKAETILSRDQLPELPENPPTILPPLLEYTFKDLGMDNLKFIDLRQLDIPTGLGANVIMLIGTARSVKHLNVSADRLCRWMRSTWKLSPYADGLLGRNELKIKLRRKARRARAATEAGALYEEKDDGITTGWICVNAGVVQEDLSQPTLQEQGFEGFGSLGRGTRLVVQMFTEEKRAEVDLETLWTKRLERAEQEKKKLLNATSETPPEEVRDLATQPVLSSDHDFRHLPRIPMNFSFHQRRGLHTNRPKRSKDGVERSQPDVEPVSSSSEFPADPGDGGGATPRKSGVTMAYLFNYLSNLPAERVRYELGTGEEDYDSTLALQLFHARQAEISPAASALAHIRLLCIAISSQHPSYSKDTLWKTFNDYIRCNFHVPKDLGILVVSALLTERPVDTAADKCTKLPDSDKELALRVCDHLSLCGIDLLNMKIFNMLYKAASAGGPGNEALIRIPRVIEGFDIPFDPEESRIFMWALFENKDYDNFWKYWHQLSLKGRSRTATDYEQLFRVHAELGDSQRARQCVGQWEPMMDKESPPVEKNPAITQYVRACRELRSLEDDQLLELQRRLLDEEADPWF